MHETTFDDNILMDRGIDPNDVTDDEFLRLASTLEKVLLEEHWGDAMWTAIERAGLKNLDDWSKEPEVKFAEGDMVADRQYPEYTGEVMQVEDTRYQVEWFTDEGPTFTWVKPWNITKHEED